MTKGVHGYAVLVEKPVSGVPGVLLHTIRGSEELAWQATHTWLRAKADNPDLVFDRRALRECRAQGKDAGMRIVRVTVLVNEEPRAPLATIQPHGGPL